MTGRSAGAAGCWSAGVTFAPVIGALRSQGRASRLAPASGRPRSRQRAPSQSPASALAPASERPRSPLRGQGSSYRKIPAPDRPRPCRRRLRPPPCGPHAPCARANVHFALADAAVARVYPRSLALGLPDAGLADQLAGWRSIDVRRRSAPNNGHLHAPFLTRFGATATLTYGVLLLLGPPFLATFPVLRAHPALLLWRW